MYKGGTDLLNDGCLRQLGGIWLLLAVHSVDGVRGHGASAVRPVGVHVVGKSSDGAFVLNCYELLPSDRSGGYDSLGSGKNSNMCVDSSMLLWKNRVLHHEPGKQKTLLLHHRVADTTLLLKLGRSC